MTKWNKYKNYKKHREQQLIFKIRQGIADVAQVPVEYVRGGFCSKEGYRKLKDINNIFINGCDKLTSHLPRKLKKKFRKSYEGMKL